MKLIDLLSAIPDECKIGIAHPEDQRHGVIGYKDDAITRFAYRNKLIKEQVENMDVRHVYPAADVQGADTQLFGIDTLPLYVSLEIIIEIE